MVQEEYIKEECMGFLSAALSHNGSCEPHGLGCMVQEEYIKEECMEFDHKCREAIRRRLANLATCG